jgi:hypothetical protein
VAHAARVIKWTWPFQLLAFGLGLFVGFIAFSMHLLSVPLLVASWALFLVDYFFFRYFAQDFDRKVRYFNVARAKMARGMSVSAAVGDGINSHCYRMPAADACRDEGKFRDYEEVERSRPRG